MSDGKNVVGFIGLGDQGLPMAAAGFELHAWARRPETLAPLDGAATTHDTPESLAAAVDVVALCVGTDQDVADLAEQSLLPSMREGALPVNHGTGTPRNPQSLAETARPPRVIAVDAPASGGQPAAEDHTLTTMVGGSRPAFETVRPVAQTFSAHVFHLGDSGAGQAAKVFNNTLMMMNQAAIADIAELADAYGIDPAALLEVLKHASAGSRMLELLNTMVRPDTVDHLSEVEQLDMDIFADEMSSRNLDHDAVTARARSGASRLPALTERINR